MQTQLENWWVHKREQYLTNECYTFECYRNLEDREVMSSGADRDVFLRMGGIMLSLTMALGFKEVKSKGHNTVLCCV